MKSPLYPSIEQLTRSMSRLQPDYLLNLKTLVEMDSGSDDKAGLDSVCTQLEALFQAAQIPTTRYPAKIEGDHLLANLSGKGTGKILLLGHMDTVYPRGTAASRPLRTEGTRALGPGTCDMKGGLLLGLYALKTLQETEYDGFEEIRFLIVSDEETNQRSSIPIIQEQSRFADVVFCLEPGRPNGEVVSSRKGIRWFSVEAHGKAAHAGVEPGRGANAILAIARLIPELQDLNHAFQDATLNVGIIEGGRFPNVVPDFAKIRLDVRAFSERDLDRMETRIRQACETEYVPGVRMVCTLEDGAYMPAMERTAGVEKLEKLAIQLGIELGLDIRGLATGGGSDASFASEQGIPVLDGLGPIGGKAHSPDEYLEIESIVPRAVLLAKMIIVIAADQSMRR